MTTVIIGYGVVGKNIHKEFPESDIVDPMEGFYVKSDIAYDIGFVCVPTDMLPDGSVDTSIVKQVVSEYQQYIKILVVKSTVPPGTTEKLGDSCVFSPEYYGATVHANDPQYNFVILGGHTSAVRAVAELYKRHKPATYQIWKTDSKTAEYVKYMENFWLGTKVTFVNAFSQIAEHDGVDFDELRELWLLDPRINRSHTFVMRDKPYYDSHCLNKDIPGIIAYARGRGFDVPFLEAVLVENSRRKAI